MPDFLNVQEALNNLEFGEGMSGAEFGCGSAVFTVALAKKMPKGKVYAIDIQEEKLSALKGRLAHENVSNVTTILCDLEETRSTGLPDSSLDIVLIPNMLFQIENKNVTIGEAARILKTGGQMLALDWLKDGPFSPKEGMVAPKEIKSIADDFGLSLKKEFAAGDYHFGLVFVKK